MALDIISYSEYALDYREKRVNIYKDVLITSAKRNVNVSARKQN